MLRRLIATLFLAAQPMLAGATSIDIPIVFLKQVPADRPTLSNLDPIPEDLARAGAELALKDNKTTGQFLGHTYALTVLEVTTDADVIASAQSALQQSQLLVLDVAPQNITTIADLTQAQSALLFNASAGDIALRGSDCRTNLLHSIPSDAMRADALMQFARSKRWDDLALISGPNPIDLTFAQALRDSAHKFGLKISAELTWDIDADMRRNAAQEIPLLTQRLGDYDLLLVADETDDFGRYIPFNTWRARPVAGSAGLMSQTWSRVVEQWGAAQLQSRFHDLAQRDMRSRDYGAWAAVRSIGEAVTRTGSSDAQTLRDFILSETFELAGFKGRPLSYRSWNGQLRQPIPLVTQRAVVTQAPLPGYLHQTSEMDTLGADQPESTCEAFR